MKILRVLLALVSLVASLFAQKEFQVVENVATVLDAVSVNHNANPSPPAMRDEKNSDAGSVANPTAR